MYKVSPLRDTITETWYFVYLHAYKVSHRRDLALTELVIWCLLDQSRYKTSLGYDHIIFI